MNTKLYLYNGVSPFTRISGNRYLPFFDKYDVNIDEKENEYIKTTFWEVLDKDYTFSQSSIMNGVLRISSKLVKEKYDPLIINYCLIQIEDKKYYYFIEKARYTQDDTIEYILYLDTFATYFRYLNWKLKFKVDRLNFRLTNDFNQYLPYKLTKLVFYNKDDSIGEIPLTNVWINYTNNNNNNKTDFNIKKFYAYVIPNSNTIEQNVLFKQPLDEGYLLDVTDKKNKFNKETSDNQIFYEIVGPNLGNNIPKEIINYEITSFSSLMSKLKESNKERPKLSFYMKPANKNNLRSRKKLILTKVEYKGVVYKETFDLFWGFNYGIPISENESKTFDCYDIKDSEFCERWFTSGISNDLKELIILDAEGKTNFVRLNEDFEFDVKQLIYNIPINNQLMKIVIYNWYGEKIEFNPIEVMSYNYKVELKFYGMSVMNGFETYLSFKNVLSKYKIETYNNIIKFDVFKKISHRTDSKQEFLQSQRNTIEAQKTNILLSYLGNLLNNIISNGSSSGLANSIGNTMLAGGYAARMVGEGISSTVNYTNSIRMIDAKIKDSGLQRSIVSNETTGSLEEIMNSSIRYNKFGWCFMLKLPDKYYASILEKHFNKFGYQVNEYLTIEEFMTKLWNDKSKLNFQYIKSDDFSSLQPQSILPQEVFNDINGLFASGVHIWFIKEGLDYFKKNYEETEITLDNYEQL